MAGLVGKGFFFGLISYTANESIRSTCAIVLFTVKKSSKNKKEVAKFLISMLQRKQNE